MLQQGFEEVFGILYTLLRASLPTMAVKPAEGKVGIYLCKNLGPGSILQTSQFVIISPKDLGEIHR